MDVCLAFCCRVINKFSPVFVLYVFAIITMGDSEVISFVKLHVLLIQIILCTQHPFHNDFIGPPLQIFFPFFSLDFLFNRRTHELNGSINSCKGKFQFEECDNRCTVRIHSQHICCMKHISKVADRVISRPVAFLNLNNFIINANLND